LIQGENNGNVKFSAALARILAAIELLFSSLLIPEYVDDIATCGPLQDVVGSSPVLEEKMGLVGLKWKKSASFFWCLLTPLCRLRFSRRRTH